MNAFFVFLCFLVAVSTHSVRGREVYDQKEQAIKEIEKAHSEVKKEINATLAVIKTESEKSYDEAIKSARTSLNETFFKSLDKVKEEKVKAARSGIARGKPLTAFDCIVRTANDAKTQLSKIQSNSYDSLESVLDNRKRMLNTTEEEIDLIKIATEELVEEAKKKINGNLPNIEALKTDGIKKCNTALSRVRELKKRIIDLNTGKLIHDISEKSEKEFSTRVDIITKDLQKCVS